MASVKDSKFWAFLLGLGLVWVVLDRIGLSAVLPWLREMGWQFAWVMLYMTLPIALAGQAWRCLFDRKRDPGFGRIVYASWIGLACNWLLPVAQIGGELVKAGWIARPEKDTEPWATMIVDKTFQILTQVVFALVGLVGFCAYRWDPSMVLGAGIILFGLALAGGWLLRMQQRGLFGLSMRLMQKVMGREHMESMGEVASVMDARVRALYAQPWTLWKAFCWRLTFRLGLAGEIYLMMHLMGHPISIGQALILASLGQSARMAAFLIPGGLGAQEGAFAMIAAGLGLPPGQGLAVSLGRRAREVLVGLPALMLAGEKAWRIWRQPKPGDRAAR